MCLGEAGGNLYGLLKGFKSMRIIISVPIGQAEPDAGEVWRADGQALPGEKVWSALKKPDAIARAARGEAVGEPAFPTGK